MPKYIVQGTKGTKMIINAILKIKSFKLFYDCIKSFYELL